MLVYFAFTATPSYLWFCRPAQAAKRFAFSKYDLTGQRWGKFRFSVVVWGVGVNFLGVIELVQVTKDLRILNYHVIFSVLLFSTRTRFIVPLNRREQSLTPSWKRGVGDSGHLNKKPVFCLVCYCLLGRIIDNYYNLLFMMKRFIFDQI